MNYHPDKIYWINQGVRSLLLIALGTSAGVAIATPVTGYMLHSYCGLSKETSNYITTGVALGINLLTNPMSLMEASIAIGTSVGASFVGSKLPSTGYNFVRDTFFSAKNVEVTKDTIPQTTAKLS